MNTSDPQPMQSPHNLQIPQTHIQVRDPNIPFSNPPEALTLGSTHSMHGTTEHLSPVDRERALHHIRVLEAQTSKLYEDNCQLVNAVNMLNDRLVFVGASQDTQLVHLTEVQEQLRTSEMNRTLLNRKYYDLLNSIPANSPHRHLADELRVSRNAYAELEQAYHVLKDKYARMKGAMEATQQQFRGPVPIPHAGPIPHAVHAFHPAPPIGAPLHPDQHRVNVMPPPPAMSSTSMQNPIPQQQSHRRRSSESVITQPPGPPPLRIGHGPVATTWLPPLPTPPPSVDGSQMSPTGFLIYPPMGAASHPLARQDHHLAHKQRTPGTRTMSGPPVLSNPPEQGPIKISDPPFDVDQRRDEVTPPNVASTNTPRSTSLQSRKRPSFDMQPSGNPEGASKRPRVEGSDEQTQTEKSVSRGSESDPIMVLSPSPTAEEGQNDGKPAAAGSAEDLRSYEECVNLIFEKDADVENGIFCGLCLDRYAANMIPEPPDILVQPVFDLLVGHCMTMHPLTWETLRHRKS